MRRYLFLLPVLAFVLLGIFLYLALQFGNDFKNIPSALIGKSVPDFELASFTDETRISPQQFMGKPYIINYFASWCLPCRAEHPLLKELHARSGVPILGILYKDKREDAEAFLAELGNPFSAIAFDQDGRTGIEFGLYGIPETYIIDKDGKIVFRHAGPIDPTLLRETLLPLLESLKS